MDRLGALAIFVKTPHVSPVKTRLAADIGRASADEFYRLALRATAAVAEALRNSEPGLEVYWAVAEEEALGRTEWSQFANLAQGTGTLGARLARVYEACVTRHGFAGLIGADSPHLSVPGLLQAVRLSARHRADKFVMGETIDGGFYFFGGGRTITNSTWTSTFYSTASTATDLRSRLDAETLTVERDFDVDVGADLKNYRDPKFDQGLLPEQRDLVDWARDLKI